MRRQDAARFVLLHPSSPNISARESKSALTGPCETIARRRGSRIFSFEAWRLADSERGRIVSDQQRFHDKQWSLIVAKAWADDEFKNRLMSNPKAVLREHGLEIAPGMQVNLVEDTEDTVTFVLPPSPSGELAEEELSPVAGTDSFSGICGRCGRCGCGCGGCRGCDAF